MEEIAQQLPECIDTIGLSGAIPREEAERKLQGVAKSVAIKVVEETNKLNELCDPKVVDEVEKVLAEKLKENTKLRNLPDSITGLKNLRPLEFCATPLRSLPDSIVSLVNLRTLDLCATKHPDNTLDDCLKLLKAGPKTHRRVIKIKKRR